MNTHVKAPRTEAGVGPHDEVIIGSLDVKALYPSLDIDATADVVIESFQNSEFEVEGVDSQELGLYLAVYTKNGTGEKRDR